MPTNPPANSDLPDLPHWWRCNECGQAHEESTLLKAPNPFAPTDEMMGCPNCGEPNNFREVCQVGDCEEDATCGRPRFRGFRYARLCGRHFSEHTPKAEE